MSYRIGIGFDVHKTAPGDSIILGGIKIDAPFSLSGHSDADVLIHAITDAVLGAMALPDIGNQFPDSSQENKNRNSADFLQFSIEAAGRKGYRLNNLDTVIICEKPKIAPYRAEIAENLAKLCNSSVENIGIKATTSEGLGFTGREEGVAAKAVVLLSR